MSFFSTSRFIGCGWFFNDYGGLFLSYYIHAINPNLNIEPINKKVKSVDDVLELMRGVDLFVLCGDEPKHVIDRLVNRAAYSIGIPWIQGSYASTVVNYSLSIPGQTPCMECLYLAQKQNINFIKGRESSEIFGSRNAVTAPIAALTGNLLAHETMNLLTGLKSQLSPMIFQLDLVTMEKHDIQREYYDGCPVCTDPRQFLDIEM